METLTRTGGRIERGCGTHPFLLVKARILELIRDGEFKVGEQLPSEPELASQFGVSRMTANRAILALVDEGVLSRAKGRGTFVKSDGDPTRVTDINRILAVPNVNLADAWDDFYYGSIFAALHAKASQLGLDFVIADPVVETIGRIDRRTGLICVGLPLECVPLANELANGACRAVSLGASWDSLNMPSVDSDNLLGGGLAVAHLSALGHREIAFIGAFEEDSNSQDRLRGYRVQQQIFGLKEHAPVWYTALDGSDEEADSAVLAMLNHKSKITGFFAAGAQVSVRVHALAQRVGREIPAEISIVGYDDPAVLSLIDPPVTTVAQPLAEMANLAFSLIAEPDPAQPKTSVLNPTLIIKASTAPVQQTKLSNE